MNVVAIDSRNAVRRELTLRHLRQCSHIALKGHVLVDQALGRIISQRCLAAHVLDGVDIDFYQKAKLARALAGDMYGADPWDLVWRLYLIRNEIAYRVESHSMRPLMTEFVRVESEWSRTAMPSVSNDDELARSFADSIESLLVALAAIEGRGHKFHAAADRESL